jgi:hypothetical protein
MAWCELSAWYVHSLQCADSCPQGPRAYRPVVQSSWHALATVWLNSPVFVTQSSAMQSLGRVTDVPPPPYPVGTVVNNRQPHVIAKTVLGRDCHSRGCP